MTGWYPPGPSFAALADTLPIVELRCRWKRPIWGTCLP